MDIQLLMNHLPEYRSECGLHSRSQDSIPAFLTMEAAKTARAFHAGFPEYSPTPLWELPGLAKRLCLGKISVKDESYRFGLNSFKGLGSSFAVGCYIARQLGRNIESLSYHELASEDLCERIGVRTFVTATDGNHGRGLAWTAKKLRQQAVVYLPVGSSPERLAHIIAQGGHAQVLSVGYDEAVAYAAQQARENNWILVQDTSWPGYRQIPSDIMQGYTTMALEVLEQLAAPPTHIFVQAGVGSFAAAMLGFFSLAFGGNRPIGVVLEPSGANCVFYNVQRTIRGSRCLQALPKPLDTVMEGLSCGLPSSIAWKILKSTADAFISCGDYYAGYGMRVLSAPKAGDQRIVSGDSGAVGIGVLCELMTNPACQEMRQKLKLDQHSCVLLFSTEGDTDITRYEKMVWNGLPTR